MILYESYTILYEFYIYISICFNQSATSYTENNKLVHILQAIWLINKAETSDQQVISKHGTCNIITTSDCVCLKYSVSVSLKGKKNKTKVSNFFIKNLLTK